MARSLVCSQIILLLIPAIVILSSDPIKASPFVVKERKSLEKSHADSNATVDPCDDFCRFTYTTSPVKALQRNPTFVNANEIFNTTFLELSQSEPEFLIDIQHMHIACVNAYATKEVDPDNLRKILKLLGGWPVIEGDSWPAENASWRQLQIKLSKLGFEGFIKTYYSDEDNTVILAPLSDLFSRRLNDSSRNALQSAMAAIAVTMGADQNFADREIAKAMSLETNLARVAFHDNNDKLWDQVDLRDLEGVFNTSAKEVIHLLPPHFNQSRDRLQVPESKFFELGIVLDNAPIRDVFNYVLMRLIANLTLLSDDLDERMFQCLDFVSARFPEAHEILFVRKYLHKNTKKSIQALINQVKGKVKEEAAELNRNLNMLINWAYVDLSRIDSISLSLGYPDEFFNDQMIDEYYENLLIRNEDFIGGLYNYTLFKLSNSRVPSFDFRENLRAYVPPNNNVLSDGHLSAMQLYTYSDGTNTPKYVVYGELVSLFSKIISKTVSIEDRMHTDFFQRPHFKYQIESSMEKRINDWQTQIAYSLYEDWLQIHGPEPKPPGLENYTNRQIFWMYRSHLECHQNNLSNQWWTINCGLRKAFKCGRFH